MYKIYGIIIFIFLLILIYLLNINNQESGTQYIQEGFYALSDDYERIDGVGFNSNSDNITNLNTSLILEDVLKECNTDKCKGITIIENDSRHIMCHTSHVLLSHFNVSIKLYGHRFARVLDKRIHSQVTADDWADAAAAAAGKVQ